MGSTPSGISGSRSAAVLGINGFQTRLSKVCTVCGEEKPLEEYHNHPNGKYGKKSMCKSCASKKWTAYRKKNKERLNKNSIEYNKKHRKHLYELRVIYEKEHPEKIKEWTRNRWYKQNNYRIKNNLGRRVISALKKYGLTKDRHTKELVGCSIAELKRHIQDQFEIGMSWDNYGRGGWVIDHIKPCAMFDLTNQKQRSKCFHYTNLRPLWDHENAQKYSTYKGVYYGKHSKEN
ncbi:hypothetical protein FACS1894110_10060 [Spirochaetia bacterium]|nr:hypothetical protein FACS1894110_10060 [Spirochaetia bacterium]